MRLWSLHPRYLDPQGLVALWREALLARAVLRGQTRGYRHHPQLQRFRAHPSPRLAINAYLAVVHAEALDRGYHFDRGKIGPVRAVSSIAVEQGQIDFEWRHLLAKLEHRSPALFGQSRDVADPACHPLFQPRPGPVASWERASPSSPQ
ncbi:pyrimidine dimer DNA glycosylase/endonuclease V [Flavobacterium sp. MXW15]|uniref:Pyrimidine dimer DNA glycosylase/endonuclease V n=1 Tax=Xanthomonas chitinilytica TaxID=2989819 RepID=A0ABT3JS00_9XANT|nr:pyrimidine dimer DNA glycosylase/endonuclease V [Xanthomonas sp. H13-6]MCW4453685.1 pyrimidine dimer DNA glycosylase/endonuclease V [Flavobacterium sp. MXW15]MCW4471264.1 pyrimidine dimer DNA glycosylase/endonuclease V [Xanthomonas sp. H13-6]